MPKLLPIITNPNEILRKVSKEISLSQLNSVEFKALLSDMAKTMKEKDGVGLAAPQIGKNIRLAVVHTKDGDIFLINPLITKKSWAKEIGEEGCLSLPNVFGNVKRHKKITVRCVDQNGKKITLEASGMLARVMQHEIDHLDGVLFIDTAKNIHEIDLGS